MKILKNTFFTILTFFTFFLLLELFSRSLVFFITKNKIIYSYGFNKTIFFKINDLSEFNFLLYSTNLKKVDNLKENFNKSEEVIIWTFGGSTTKGDEPRCGHYTSSWPDELSNLNKSFVVKNFAKKGNSTDYAVNVLFDQNLNQKPNIILWAGKYNDQYNFVGLKDNSKLIKRIDYTLELNSVFYFLFNDLIERITFKIVGYKEPATRKMNIEKIVSSNYEKSIKKYEQNTIKAINFAKNYNIDFHIISLFASDSGTKIGFYDYWFNSAEKLSNEYKIFYFKTEDEASKVIKNYKNEKLFCDKIHQTLEGNILTATIINEYLMKTYDFQNN
jgi:hypothetical protein